MWTSLLLLQALFLSAMAEALASQAIVRDRKALRARTVTGKTSPAPLPRLARRVPMAGGEGEGESGNGDDMPPKGQSSLERARSEIPPTSSRTLMSNPSMPKTPSGSSRNLLYSEASLKSIHEGSVQDLDFPSSPSLRSIHASSSKNLLSDPSQRSLLHSSSRNLVSNPSMQSMSSFRSSNSYRDRYNEAARDAATIAKQGPLLNLAIRWSFMRQKAPTGGGTRHFTSEQELGEAVRLRVAAGGWREGLAHWPSSVLREHLATLHPASSLSSRQQTPQHWIDDAIRVWVGLVRPHAAPRMRGVPSSEKDLLAMGQREERVQRSTRGQSGAPYVFVHDKWAERGMRKGVSTGNLLDSLHANVDVKKGSESGLRGGGGSSSNIRWEEPR